jgi:shikimate dehydrogenase
MEKVFGLIGAAVSHSFSKSYFDEKFFREGLRDYHYELFLWLISRKSKN